MYIPVTMKEIKQKLENQYGSKHWPTFALERYAELKEMIVTLKVRDTNIDREYQVLREWLIAMVELGIDAAPMTPF
jgi:hypothetical protein